MPAFSEMPAGRSYAYIKKTAKLCELWDNTKLLFPTELDYLMENPILLASGAPMMSLEKRCGKPVLFNHNELSSSLSRYFSVHMFLLQRML